MAHKSKTAAPPPNLDDVPTFLRRKYVKPPPAEDGAPAPQRKFVAGDDARLPPPLHLPPLPPGLRYSEFTHEESGLTRRPGVVVRRWAASDFAGAVSVARTALEESEEAERRREERKTENLERLRLARETRPNPLAGKVPLKKLMADEKIELKTRHARAAIDAAKLIHMRYHFAPDAVTLAHAARVLREYRVPAKAGRAPKVQHDPALVIRWDGGENPKKEGSSARERWALLISCAGGTVGRFLERDGNPTTLSNAVKQGRVMLTTEKPAAPAGAEKRRKKR